MYVFLSETFFRVAIKHAPLTKKFLEEIMYPILTRNLESPCTVDLD